MCLVAIAIDQSRRFPLVIAANRDEYYERAAAPLDWWSPGRGLPRILSGRDLESGGTWLGLTEKGRLALVTNVRDPSRQDAMAPSRGAIVPGWLAADMFTDRFWMRTALSGYNPFNLIAADFPRGECYWASNLKDQPQRLGAGLYGVSNAFLDTSWPKVDSLKSRLQAALVSCMSVETLISKLFEALADRTAAPLSALPSTGVPREWEKILSSAFIRSPEFAYGTRCSTLVVSERIGKRLITHVLERTFCMQDDLTFLRRSLLKDWPPRHNEVGIGEAVL